MDSGQEIASGFVIARCNGTKLFELAKEILNQVSCLV